MPRPVSRGVIYVAFGPLHFDELCVSAASVRRVMPHLPITLFGDRTPPSELFDNFVRVETAGVLRGKLECLGRSPYDRTLFLDTDTYLMSEVSELFDLLDHFDVAASQDRSYLDWFPAEAGVPPPFREFNTGVIVYRRSAASEQLFADCLKWYDKLASLPPPAPRFRGQFPDQPAFRAAAYHTDVRLATLTFEYNCRFPYYGHVSGEVKILHGREFLTRFSPAELDRVATRLNQIRVPRVFVAGRLWSLAASASRLSRRYVARNCIGYLRPRWRYLISRGWARFRS